MYLFVQLHNLQAGYRNVFMCFFENIGLDSDFYVAGQ